MNYKIIILSLVIIGIALILNMFFKYLNKKLKKIKKIWKIKSNYSYFQKFFSYLLFVLSVIFLATSLLFVLFSEKEDKNNNFSNTNVVFVLDVSKSMNSIDIKQWNHLTTRLDFSKQAIKNYISHHPSYKYWLVIFAQQAQAVVPLTNDINTFTSILEWVDYRNLTKQGTNFNEALKLALERFKAYKWQNILVFISDGWDPEDYKWINVKIPSNLKTFVFWVGSKEWWKILLWRNLWWEYKFQKYKWKYVITKLNEENLQKLANDINAKYFRLSDINSLEILNKYIKNIKIIKNQKFKEDNSTYALLFSWLAFVWFLLSYIIFFYKKNI